MFSRKKDIHIQIDHVHNNLPAVGSKNEGNAQRTFGALRRDETTASEATVLQLVEDKESVRGVERITDAELTLREYPASSLKEGGSKKKKKKNKHKEREDMDASVSIASTVTTLSTVVSEVYSVIMKS